MTSQTPVVRVYRSSAATVGLLSLLGEGVRDIVTRRRLIGYLARADLKKMGTDTLFGNLWWILDPLLQMVIYTIMVTVIFARSQEAYPLFVFAAILPWKWFTSSINDSVSSVSGNDKLIKQIQFPKLVLPVGALVAGISQFAFGLIPLGGMLVLFYPHHISPYLLLLPVVALVQVSLNLSLGLLVAATNVFLRDIANLSRHVLRLWFYLSPALYGADTIANMGKSHPTLARLLQLNPFYPVLNSYRDVVYYGRAPEWIGLLAVTGVGVALLVVAIIVFKRLEPSFAKVL